MENIKGTDICRIKEEPIENTPFKIVEQTYWNGNNCVHIEKDYDSSYWENLSHEYYKIKLKLDNLVGVLEDKIKENKKPQIGDEYYFTGKEDAYQEILDSIKEENSNAK